MKLLDFYADWCGQCKALTPTVDKFAANNSTIRVEKIDADENEELVDKYNVKSLPTLIALDGNNEVINRISGNVSYMQIEGLFHGSNT